MQKVRHLARGENEKQRQGRMMGCSRKCCDSPNFSNSHFFFFHPHIILISTQFLLLSYQMVLVMSQWAGTCDMQAATDRCSLEIAVPNF